MLVPLSLYLIRCFLPMDFWCRMSENQEQEVSMCGLHGTGGYKFLRGFGKKVQIIDSWDLSGSNTSVVLMSSKLNQEREISSKGISGKWGSILTSFSISYTVLECKLHEARTFCLLFMFYPQCLRKVPDTWWVHKYLLNLMNKGTHEWKVVPSVWEKSGNLSCQSCRTVWLSWRWRSISCLQEVITVRVQDPRVQNEGSWNSYVDYKIFLHVSASNFGFGIDICQGWGTELRQDLFVDVLTGQRQKRRRVERNKSVGYAGVDGRLLVASCSSLDQDCGLVA